MKESLKDREGSSPTGNLLVDPGCESSMLLSQAECDELAQRAEALKEENASLRSELNRITTEYDQLLAQNASLKGRLGEGPGQDNARSGGNDQHVGNGTQQTGQTEIAQSGQ
ncbi:hypothetical protein CsSME_00049705 [Camellia sinensis var. sinensis]